MDDQPVSGIVGGNGDRHPVTEDDTDAKAPHASAQPSEEGVSGIRFHGEIAAGQHLDHGTIYLN